MVRFAALVPWAAALLIPLASAAAGSSDSSVQVLTPENFDKVVFGSGKPSLVEFYAPWCGHCKTLAPVYDELAAAFASAGKVNIAKVDADDHKDLGKKYGVTGFPTLKWFDGKSKEPEAYSSGRDLESLTKFITEKTGAKAKAPKAAPSHVEMLTDTTFKSKIGGDQDVLLAITAPWCGHCKTLAPIYEKVATDFAADGEVLIAKLDAEAENAKATAQDLGVSGYPTLKFFPKGSKEPEDYSGARTEEALVDFVNSKAGTFRVAGGGLNTKAGTIDAIDAVLTKYVIGGVLKDAEKATEEIKKVAQGAKDKSTEYYLKALAKLTGNPEYAMKEQTRLAGLLKKGGLSPEKIDDMTKRSNILAKFLIKDDGELKSEL